MTPAAPVRARDGERLAHRLAQDQLLEAHPERMFQHAPAQAADRARCHFEHPDPLIVDANLGMNRPRREPGGGARARHVMPDLILHGARQSRWRDVQGFLEVGPFQRIGLVEQRERRQLPPVEHALERVLASGNVVFDDEAQFAMVAVGLRLNGAHAVQRLDQRGEIVSTNDATTRRQPPGLDDHGERQLRCPSLRVLAGGQMMKSRTMESMLAQQSAKGQLVTHAAHRRHGIAGQPEVLGNQRRELDPRIVDRQDGVRRAVDLAQEDFRRVPRLIEMERHERTHAPQRREPVAVIGRRDDLHAEPFRRGQEIVVAIAGRRQQQEDSFHPSTRQNDCSCWSVGSAQQYHGSDRWGMGAPSSAARMGVSRPAASWAMRQTAANTSRRGRFSSAAEATYACRLRCSSSTRRSEWVHG